MRAHSLKGMSCVDALTATACSIALENVNTPLNHSQDVDIFVCLTDSGKIARFISKYKPFPPILACSTSSAVVR